MAFALILELWRPCPGAHCARVWVKSGPSLAKGSTKMIVFWGKGAPGQNTAIYYVFVLFGWSLAGISLGVPAEALREAMDHLVLTEGRKGSVGIRSQTDAK